MCVHLCVRPLGLARRNLALNHDRSEIDANRAGCWRDAPWENIEYRMMTPRTECVSTFLWSLKEISGVNDHPLLRTDQKHARTKTVLGGAGHRACLHPINNGENKNVPFDRISATLLGGAGQSSIFAPQK